MTEAELFEESYRELRPRAPMPRIHVRFARFANVNSTIRLGKGEVRVALSDLLEGAPDAVLRSLAHILLAKLYRKPIHPRYTTRYRHYINSAGMSSAVQRVRQLRGRKRLSSAAGSFYDLEPIFDELNLRYFHGLLGRPLLSWSQGNARQRLGHYDPGHNTIVVSRIFDRASVPLYVVEYILYHEMLHLKHPVRYHAGRRCVHSRAFQEEEKMFARLEAAKAFLKIL